MPPAPGGYDGGFEASEAVTPFCARFRWAVKLIGAALPFSVLRSGFALATVAAGFFLTLCVQSGVVHRFSENWGWRDLVWLLNT